MTQREFYEAVITANVNEEITTFATEALDKMNKANEKRRNTPSKTQIENGPLYEKIVNEILTSELVTASDVAAALDVKTQKASALLRYLVAEGKAVSEEVKVQGKGNVKGYKIAE